MINSTVSKTVLATTATVAFVSLKVKLLLVCVCVYSLTVTVRVFTMMTVLIVHPLGKWKYRNCLEFFFFLNG